MAARPPRRAERAWIPALFLAVFASAPEGRAARQRSEVGLPLLRVIEPREFDGDPQVFDAAQGPDGVLHFACPGETAVLHYDGERWRRTHTGFPVLSVDVDDSGRVWAGCGAELGYLDAAGPDGEPGFVSLSAHLGEREGSPPSFIVTRCTPRGTFFLSSELLALWDGATMTTWDAPANGGFMDVEWLGEDVFVLEATLGLNLLVDGELVVSDALGPEGTLYDALYSDGERLLGTRLDLDGLRWIRNGETEERELDVPELLAAPTYVSDVVVTGCGTMVVACSTGVLLIDSQGGFQAWLDDDRGLPNSFVYSLALDREGGVWAALAYGMARIDPSPAVSFFGEALGLEGSPLAFTRHEGRGYCGTFDGLFRLEELDGRARFVRVEEAPALGVWDLLSTAHGLLIGTELGLFHLEGEHLRRLSSQQPVSIGPLDGDPDGEFAAERVVVAGFDALWTLRWEDGEEPGWRADEPFPVSWTTESIVVQDSALWVHSADHELFLLERLPADRGFGRATRVPGLWHAVGWTSGGVLAWDDEELVRVTAPDGAPDPAPGIALGWSSRRAASRRVAPVVDEQGHVWLLDRNSLQRLERGGDGRLLPTSDVAWSSAFDLDGIVFDPAEPAVAWMPTHRGLVRVDTDRLRAPRRADPHVATFARTEDEALVALRGGETLGPFAGIRVEVAAGVFDGSAASYRYRLEGHEREWTPWTSQAIKEYTNLPGGDYVLRVEARDPAHVLGRTSLAFGVKPPWYMTLPAFLAGMAALGVLGFGTVRWRSRRLRRENERLGRMVAERTRDLAEQRTREREMEERLREVERFESLGAMAGGIAHDFNNYLTSILGYAELALGEGSDRELREEYLRNVTTISRQAAELCSGLLSLTGGAPPANTPVELSALAGGMESLLRTSVGDRGELRLELDGDVPLVAGDVGQLRRALVNLAVNAAEASEEAHGPIHVRTGVQECDRESLEQMVRAGPREPGRYAWVEVEDRGVGLEPESVHRVFDPFYSTKFVGRGLGLSTVFRIVALHGGAIDIRTELGRGTRVRLLFPEARDVEELPRAPGPRPAGPRLSGHVLIVDDDARIRDLVSDYCARLGLHATTAAGGREALRAMARHGERIGAVMLDLSMPGMGGLEVLEEVRSGRGDLPVLLMSGYADPVPPETLDERTRFLAKPFSFREFAGLIEDMVRRESA